MDAHLSLLEKTGCRTLLRPSEKPEDSTSQHILNARAMDHEIVPTLEELLSPQTVSAYPWPKGIRDVACQPFLVLHTSGSTGLPKPVDITHGLIATIDAQQVLPDVDGRCVTAREWANRSVYTALPPFHSAGINFFSYSVFQSTELVFGPSDQPPSISTVEQILTLHAADSGVMAPSLLAEVAMEDGILQKVSQWSSVTFGGGPLPQEAGNALWQQTKVLQVLGSTETFNIPELAPRSVDEWAYHCYHPSLGIELRKHEEGLHELVFVRDSPAPKHQGAFWTFPDETEYSMKDLYEEHLSEPGLWMYRGRLDDIVVLANGEKLNPTGAERMIARSSDVKSALIVGAGHEQPALLVEPVDAAVGMTEQRRASIVKIVEHANETLPAHAQIHTSHIKVLESSDTFLRSSKGEVQRAPTTKALAEVITDLYKSAEGNASCSGSLDFTDEQSLACSLSAVLSSQFLEGKELAQSDDIFACGFDSLKALKLLRFMKSTLRDQDLALGSDLTPKAIYKHPTAAAMSKMLMNSLEGDASGPDETEASTADMQRMLDCFSRRVDDLGLPQKGRTSAGRAVVLLTGSTGSLGSYLLDGLLQRDSLDKVICLNRAGSTVLKQTEINRSRSLSTDFSRVVFTEVDLSKEHLGLSQDQYVGLAREATHIIHNAWPVIFNLPLSAFEPQLQACFRLIELAHASPNRVTTTFMSSVGAANNWSHIHDGPVPETALTDFRVAEPMGYAHSKQLAELLLAHAGQQLDLPMTVCRVGQIAGPVTSENGMWNVNEWFPSLLLSCNTLGRVPSSLGAMDCMDWIPVDLLGAMLAEVVLPPRSLGDISISGSIGDRTDRHQEATFIPSSASTASSRSTSPRSTSPESQVTSSRTSWYSAPETAVSDDTTKFLHFVNPQKTQWQDMANAVLPYLDSKLSIVPYSEWLDAFIAAADEPENDVAAAKLVEFFRDIGRVDAKRPVFSTSVTQVNSPALRDLGPVSVQWIERWLRQWDSAENR